MGLRFSSSNKIHVVVCWEHPGVELVSAHTTFIEAQAVARDYVTREECRVTIHTWNSTNWTETEVDFEDDE